VSCVVSREIPRTMTSKKMKKPPMKSNVTDPTYIIHTHTHTHTQAHTHTHITYEREREARGGRSERETCVKKKRPRAFRVPRRWVSLHLPIQQLYTLSHTCPRARIHLRSRACTHTQSPRTHTCKHKHTPTHTHTQRQGHTGRTPGTG